MIMCSFSLIDDEASLCYVLCDAAQLSYHHHLTYLFIIFVLVFDDKYPICADDTFSGTGYTFAEPIVAVVEVLNNDEAAQGQAGGCVTDEDSGIISCAMEVTEILTGTCEVFDSLNPYEPANTQVGYTLASIDPGVYTDSCTYKACLRTDGTKCCEAVVNVALTIAESEGRN